MDSAVYAVFAGFTTILCSLQLR